MSCLPPKFSFASIGEIAPNNQLSSGGVDWRPCAPLQAIRLNGESAHMRGLMSLLTLAGVSHAD
jgi:hypothetical protein